MTSLTYSAGAPALGVRPRLEIFPEYSDSLGNEALDFARQVGFNFDEDPWEEDAIDIMLSLLPNGKWNCRTYAEIVSRQNGKGVLGEVRVLVGLYLLKEEGILWSSNRYKASKKAFDRVMRWVEQHDFLTKRIKKVVKTHGEEGLILHGPNPNRITGQQEFACVARSEQTGRSFTINTNIVDEALAYTNDQAGGLLFAKSAVPNSQTLYLSSPPLRTDPEIVLFKVKAQALKMQRAGLVRGLGFRDWGIEHTMDRAAEVDRLTGRPVIDIRDPALHAATNPAYPHRISPEEIEDELVQLDAVTFARERLGAWPEMPKEEGNDTVIPAAVWRGLEDGQSQLRAPVVFCLEVDPAGKNAAICVYGLRPDGLGHAEVVAYRPGVDWLVPAAYRLRELHDVLGFVVDGTGPAKSLIPKLRLVGIDPPEDPDTPLAGQLHIMRSGDVAEAWGAFRDAGMAGDFRHRGQPHLEAALANAVTRPLGEAEALGRRVSTGTISALVGVTAARWLFYEVVGKVRWSEFDPGAWVL